MKKTFKLTLLLILVTLAFSATACGVGGGNSSSSGSESGSSTGATTETVLITATSDVIEVEDIKLEEHDFTVYFNITVDGVNIEVKKEYLDLSALKGEAGTYVIYCKYSDIIADAEVKVFNNEYLLDLSKEEIEVKSFAALDYDYLSLFSATINGEKTALTLDAVTTDLKETPGEYSYTVNFHGQTKTLKIIVTDEHDVTVAVSYPVYELEESLVETFDFTCLFSLFVDGKAEKVTLDLIDASAIKNATAGTQESVTLTYIKGDTTVTKTATVKVVSDAQTVINGKTVQTYPNSAAIDLTTLFTITKGGKQIPVTSDMIEGSVDYSKAGENVITLTYDGVSANATVEVVVGVVISYATSDTVIVKKGTDKNSYAFENDFDVVVNGVKFTVISDYIDVSAVDFNTVGTYTATLKIPYNDQKFGVFDVKFTYYEKEITYAVVENVYKISLKEETVTLNKGVTSYKPFNNVNLYINGIKQSLTNRADWVDSITCYAEVEGEIDFTSPAPQTVTVKVFVNGVDASPVAVSFSVIIQTDVVVTAKSAVVFTGDTLPATELFTVKEGDTEVEVTFDMISGKIDTFSAGVYYVTIDYKGVTKTAKAVVLNNAVKGKYSTVMYAIPSNNYDYDEEYGDTVTYSRVGGMKITDDGKMFIKNVEAELVDAVDENTLIINYRNNLHTVYYSDGIVVIVPENATKMPYYEEKRPYIYFNEDIWKITSKFVINSSSSYVMHSSSIAYSLDVFGLKNLKTEETLTYALKTRLAVKTSTDTMYVVTWGEGSFPETFKGKAGETSYFTFDGARYDFTMDDIQNATVPKSQDDVNDFAGITFKGVFDGKEATLAVQKSSFAFTVDGKKLVDASLYEINSMKNGGANAATNEIFLYRADYRNEEYYSYKFKVDPENETFTYVEHDKLLGFYKTDTSYVFLDGYGSGLINFNSASYYETLFTYSKLGSMLTLNYKDLSVDFEYGTSSKFVVDAFGNALTAHEGLGLNIGDFYENVFIQSGIIVKVNVETIGVNPDAVAKPELYRAIEIIDKDGTVSADASGVGEYVKTNFVIFGTPGFYQLSVEADFYDEKITAYYAIQVLKAVYKDEKIVASYGGGVIYPENGLVIDEYGRVILSVGDIRYDGSLKLGDGGEFKSELYGKNGVVSLSGKVISDGLIQIRCSGAVGFVDYYTTGTSRYIGVDGTVLRAFYVNGAYTYVLNNSLTTATGEVVTVEVINGKELLSVGAILKITATNKVIYAKTLAWENEKRGLLLSDGYLATYEGDGEVLTLNGFGEGTYGGKGITYVINGDNKITVYLDGNPTAYILDLATLRYQDMNIAFDYTLVVGKVYSYTYNFVCGDYVYSATTTFAFLENGKVRITSTSKEHDEGDDKCPDDDYSPAFCPEGSIDGTYGVKGTVVTVSANGVTMSFNVTNVVYGSAIECLTTTAPSDSHGYFGAGTTFQKGE